ncbi:hypothetical protein ABEB36_006262 [Hypothenemus hampei]
MAVVNITTFIGWIIIASAFYLKNHQYSILLMGRFMTGLSSGLCGTPAAIYMAEVASSDMRSVFTTWVSLFYAIGIFIVYLLGLILKDDWNMISLIAAGFAVLGMLFLKLLIPESPSWLASKRRYEEAKINICQLHGTKVYTCDVREELETLIVPGSCIKPEKLQSSPLSHQISKKMKMLMTEKFFRPYILVITFFFFQQFSGIFVIMFYAVDIVKQAKVRLDAYVTIVLIALVRFLSMILLSFFSKHVGRRTLSLISGSGITITMLALGSYTLSIQQGLISDELIPNISFIPLVLLILYFFISTMGFYPIPFALVSEVYPRKIRGTAAGLSTAMNFLFNFIIVKLHPTMVQGIQMSGVFYVYGVMAFVGTLFVLIWLPETRGKSLDEIQSSFITRKKTNDIEEKEQQIA